MANWTSAWLNQGSSPLPALKASKQNFATRMTCFPRTSCLQWGKSKPVPDLCRRVVTGQGWEPSGESRNVAFAGMTTDELKI